MKLIIKYIRINTSFIVLTYVEQGQEITPSPHSGKNPQASNNLTSKN